MSAAGTYPNAAAMQLEQRRLVGKGWRLEVATEREAVLVKGRRPNHLLHLVLSIISGGLWLPVWIGLAIARRERRRMLTVNAGGMVLR